MAATIKFNMEEDFMAILSQLMGCHTLNNTFPLAGRGGKPVGGPTLDVSISCRGVFVLYVYLKHVSTHPEWCNQVSNIRRAQLQRF